MKIKLVVLLLLTAISVQAQKTNFVIRGGLGTQYTHVDYSSSILRNQFDNKLPGTNFFGGVQYNFTDTWSFISEVGYKGWVSDYDYSGENANIYNHIHLQSLYGSFLAARADNWGKGKLLIIAGFDIAQVYNAHVHNNDNVEVDLKSAQWDRSTAFFTQVGLEYQYPLLERLFLNGRLSGMLPLNKIGVNDQYDIKLSAPSLSLSLGYKF